VVTGVLRSLEKDILVWMGGDWGCWTGIGVGLGEKALQLARRGTEPSSKTSPEENVR